MVVLVALECDNMYNFTSDYIQGYTKAIQDIQKIFTYIQPDLKHHKKKSKW